MNGQARNRQRQDLKYTAGVNETQVQTVRAERTEEANQN